MIRCLAQIVVGLCKGTDRFARDTAATAMVEFAIVLPVLITLFTGSYEAAHLILCDLKLEAAAETAADLVAQTNITENPIIIPGGSSTNVNATPLTSITSAVQTVMTPFAASGTQLKIAYASITYSTGTPVIDWHYEVNSATPISLASLPNGASSTWLGTASNGSTDSVIVAQLTYAYTSPFSHVLNSSYTLSESSFNRPRYQQCVPSTSNTNQTCP